MEKLQTENKNLEDHIYMIERLMNESLKQKHRSYQRKIKDFLHMFELLDSNLSLMEL